MQTLREIAISTHAQGAILFVLAATWQYIMWFGRGAGENTEIVVQFPFYVLPLLTSALSLKALEQTVRGHQRSSRWVYLSIVAGLSPWPSLGLWFKSQ
jgi:hypothetical protein